MDKRPFVIVTILLLSLSMLAVLHMNIAKATDTNVNLPDNEFMSDFNSQWGPGSYTISKSLESGGGVRFTYSGLDTVSGAAIRDDYWAGNSVGPFYGICELAGGLLDTHGYYGDFHTYTDYRLLVKNVGTSDVSIDLFMNTGYSGSDSRLDTWWESGYTDISAGATKIVTLDFSAAKVANAGDDPIYTHYPDGTIGVAMWRLNEVTGIGFQVLKKTGDGTGALVVSAVDGSTWLHTDPSTTKATYTGVDSFFDVFVNIENVAGLFGFDLKMTWDPTLLQLTGHDYATYLSTIWPTVAPHTSGYLVGLEDWTTSGTCRLVATSLDQSYTGSNTLLKLHFKVLDPQTNSAKQTPLQFEIHKLSDIDSNSITNACADGMYIVSGMEPTLSTTNTAGTLNSRTCMVYGEAFNVKINVAGAASVTDFTFEVHYDKSQVSYFSVVWGALGTGSISDDGNGKITGSVSTGTPQSGAITIVTIVFHSIVMRMWKNIDGWTNSLTSAIYIQQANLGYSSLPKLTYTKNDPLDPNQITVGADFVYTFLPIKGDLNNDGSVDVIDLSNEAHYYDTTTPGYNLAGDPIIDIFDLVVIASNFWFVYSVPSA